MKKDKKYLSGFKDGVKWVLKFHYLQLKETELIHLRKKLKDMGKK